LEIIFTFNKLSTTKTINNIYPQKLSTMSSENCEAVHQERDRLEQLFDEYLMRVNDLKNEPDSYKGTLSYREAYDECLYNMECISIKLSELDDVE
jgi:hypothetical protein